MTTPPQQSSAKSTVSHRTPRDTSDVRKTIRWIIVVLIIGGGFAVYFFEWLSDPPVPQFTFDQTSPCSLEVEFVAESDSSLYEWDFGDGTTGNSASMRHTYEREGNYQAVLRVGKFWVFRFLQRWEMDQQSVEVILSESSACITPLPETSPTSTPSPSATATETPSSTVPAEPPASASLTIRPNPAATSLANLYWLHASASVLLCAQGGALNLTGIRIIIGVNLESHDISGSLNPQECSCVRQSSNANCHLPSRYVLVNTVTTNTELSGVNWGEESVSLSKGGNIFSVCEFIEVNTAFRECSSVSIP